MAQAEKDFPKGIMVKNPKDGAPSFVLANVSIKVDDAIEYLQEFKRNTGKEWWNGQIKESQGGKKYLERDTWEPKSDPGAYVPAPANPNFVPHAANGISPDSPDLPF